MKIFLFVKRRWNEAVVLIIFVSTVLLWFFREPGFMPGWSVIFPDGYVDDSTVAAFMAVLLYFLPSEKPMFLQRTGDHAACHNFSYKPI